MSRSATVVIAYLMRHHDMALIDAFKYVRDRRPCISPNPGFMHQLVRYEQVLFGRATLDVKRYEDDRFGEIQHLILLNDGRRRMNDDNSSTTTTCSGEGEGGPAAAQGGEE